MDELLLVLANQHCRKVLSYLRNQSREVASVEELANHLRKQSPHRTEHIAVELYHSVLPRLESVGAIEYDPVSKELRYLGHSDLEALMDEVTSADGVKNL